MYIPRVNLYPDPGEYGFDWSRRQFPVRLAFVTTINKSQGQGFDRVGVWLDEPVFTHGQLYVALSRAKSPNNLRVAMPGDTTANIVYQEVL